MIEIKSSERKDNKKGPWLFLTYINDKGEPKETNIFDRKIIEEQFKGPGKYEAQWVQNGKYWNLSSLSLIVATGSTSNESENGRSQATSTPTMVPVKTDILGAKVDITKSVFSVVGVIVAAEIQAGLWNTNADKDGITTTDQIMDYTIFLSRMLLTEARNFMADVTKTEASGAYVDDAGRKHEPVGA